MKFNRLKIDGATPCRKATSLLVVLVTLVGVGLCLQQVAQWRLATYLPAIANGLLTAFKTATRHSISEIWLNPVFYGMTLAILWLERRFPANRMQKVFSIGLLQDFVWLIGDSFWKYTVLIQYVRLWDWVYGHFFKSWSINLPNQFNLPGFATLVLSILMADFLAWLVHFLQHKNSFLWRFHAVHHSQVEINLFADSRFHFGEALISFPIMLLPMNLLLIPQPYHGYYLLFRIWYARFYHANIRSNFGWLKYVLVSPQSHRVHHSTQSKHYNKNFGVIFSFWDYLFRTQYKNYQDYPETGIGNPYFPIENKFNLSSALKTYWAQQLYPFHWKN